MRRLPPVRAPPVVASVLALRSLLPSPKGPQMTDQSSRAAAADLQALAALSETDPKRAQRLAQQLFAQPEPAPAPQPEPAPKSPDEQFYDQLRGKLTSGWTSISYDGTDGR